VADPRLSPRSWHDESLGCGRRRRVRDPLVISME
jgi:hypothetical protein